MNHFRTYRTLMSNDVKKMSNLLYFELIRLIILYRVYETSGDAVEYATRTIIRPLSVPFSLRDTDLKGLLMYFHSIEDKPNITTNDKVLLNRITVDTNKIYRMLRKIRTMQDVSSIAPVFLRDIQKSLSIDDPKLRAMMTLVLKWDSLTSKEMHLLVDRINNYGTLYMRHGELTKTFRNFKKDHPMFGRDRNDDDKKGFGVGDAIMMALSGAAAKWSYDSRKRNRQSFERLKAKHDVTDVENPNRNR